MIGKIICENGVDWGGIPREIGYTRPFFLQPTIIGVYNGHITLSFCMLYSKRCNRLLLFDGRDA